MVKNLMWRVVANCLLAANRFLTKHVNINPMCQRCHIVEETYFHILFECQIAKTNWWISQLHVSNYGVSSALEWINSFFTKNSLEKCELFAMIFWQLWYHRNKWVWNQQTISVNQLSNAAGQLLHQWKMT